MTTFFTQLQKSLTQQAPAVQSEQEQLEKLARARSGKATASTAPKASNVQESVALGAARAGQAQTSLAAGTLGAGIVQQGEAVKTAEKRAMNDLGQEKALTQNQMATQAQVARDAMASSALQSRASLSQNEMMRNQSIQQAADSQLKRMASERGVAVDMLFSEFQAESKQLAYRKDAAELDQIGVLLAMSDKAYLDELSRVGREMELVDNMNYERERTQIVLGNELSALMDELNFKTGYNATGRDFERMLAEINGTFAMQIANAVINDNNKRLVVQGVTDGVKAGADIAAKSYTSNSATTTNNNPAPQSRVGSPGQARPTSGGQ
jgi:hypothetical protein